MLLKTNKDNLILQSYLTVEFLEGLYVERFMETDFYKNMIHKKILMPEFSEIGIGNQGALLMFLYALLVIPRESLEQEFKREYSGINEWLRLNANLVKSTYKVTNENELRHVRNAVAHARVEFMPNVHVAFKDINPRNNSEFELQLPLNLLGEFIVKLKSVHASYVKKRS